MNTTLPPATRASLLDAQMTLDEKIALVHGWPGQYVGDITNNARLGIPGLHLSDGPAGVSDGMQGVTALPAPILLSASWDTNLARQYGALVGNEARAKGVHVLLGPMMNMVRVPQGGRSFETFSEDPFLASAMAASDIWGLQSQGVIANAKHFVANDQEYNRGDENSVVDDRALHEIYLPPFLASVRAGVGSVCSAYNEINGDWCSESVLLKSVLKSSWGFGGFVECDWGANFATDAAATNGLDLEMPTGERFGSSLEDDISSNAVPATQLDSMVERILTTMFRFGIFDNPTTGTWDATVTSPAHAQFAENAAAQGIVLLKNNRNLLPLNVASLHSIAVIGSVAHVNAIWTGTGSAQVYLPYYLTPLDGISNWVGDEVLVNYSQGDGAGGDTNAAVQLARQSDVAIVCVGIQTGEGDDRTNLSLPFGQDGLVSAVAAANPNTIVVLYVNAGTLMPWIDQVPAALVAWYPGQEGADALAQILFGAVNPSGKLPVTFMASSNQVPANTPWQYPGTNNQVIYSEGMLMGYRWYDASNVPPLFPFGFGLSYTTFSYSNLVVGPVSPSGQAQISFDLTNTGPQSGAEVAQLYLGFPSAAAEPPKQLKGFQKVFLAPGQGQRVTLNLNWQDLAYWDVAAQAWTVPQGYYQVMVGASSRDIRLTGQLIVPSAIPSSREANLALYQPVTSSSELSTNFPGTAAVDGDPATYWCSGPGAIQWLTVDLGAVTNINRVQLNWSSNYAAGFQIRLSNDNTNWASAYSTTTGTGGLQDLLVAGAGRYVQLYATQGAGSESNGYALAELDVFASVNPSAAATTNVVWVDDAIPPGGIPGADGGDAWNWVSNNPVPFSGSLAQLSNLANGEHQHFFAWTPINLMVNTGGVLFADVWLDPTNPPSEVMLQWFDTSWEHRAYWGADDIGFGMDAPPSRFHAGPLPPLGQWTQLSVPASAVGLEGSALNGMAFTLFNGRAAWDYAGASNAWLYTTPTPPVQQMALTRVNQTWQAQFNTYGNWRYTLQRSTDLLSWTNVGPAVLASGTTLTIVDSNPPASRAFYRVVTSFP